MEGPFFLFQSIVNLMVRQTSPGHIRICEKVDHTTHIVRYVGWSDTDVKSEVLQHVGDKTFMFFSFEYADSPRQAYEEACMDHHEFHATLTDKTHPRKPEGTDYACPVKGCEHGGKS